MLIVLRFRIGYGTINPTKAGRDWSGLCGEDTISQDTEAQMQ